MQICAVAAVVDSAANGGPPPAQPTGPAQPQVYHQTVVLSAPPTEPSLLLYQPAFPLSEADYLRLTQASPFFAAVGGVLLSFGLSYILPIVVKALDTDPKARSWPMGEIYVAVCCMLLGGLSLALSYWAGTARRNVLSRIRNHFRDNPGRHQVSRT